MKNPLAHATLAVLLVVLTLAGCELLDAPAEIPPEPEVRTVEGVTTDVAAVVGTFAEGPVNRPFLLESMAEFTEYYGGVDPLHEASYHVRTFFENGGTRMWVLRAESATEAGLIGNGPAGGGMASLDEANRFNMLLVPEIFTSPDLPDRAFAASRAIAYAASRDAVMLLDPPEEASSAQDVIDWVSTSSSSLREPDAALFFGRIAIREDAQTGTTRWIGAAGAAAGIYAENDRLRGVWTAPAGPNVPAVAGVLGVDPLTSDELAALTAGQIVPLADQPVRLFGARSLAPDASEFTYIHVRRLVLYVDALVNEELMWTPGETLGNDLWDRVRVDALQTLDELWRLGAFAGASPNQGYFVTCDASVHSAEDMSRNRLRVLIGFAPLRPEEFIVRVLTFDL